MNTQETERSHAPGRSRRDFIKGTVAGVAALGALDAHQAAAATAAEAGKAANANDTSASASASSQGVKPVGTYSTDIVIVGAGYSGLAAAVQAAERGLGVIALEQQGHPGGLAGGIEGIFSLDSKTQTEAGFHVEPVEFVSLEMNYHHNRADGVKWMDLAHNSGADADWLVSHGVRFPEVTRSQMFYSREDRERPGPARAREGYVAPMVREAQRLGVRFLTYTTATDLVLEGGAVKGVFARKLNGDVVKINAGAVILATGGFAENPEYLREAGFFKPEDVVTFMKGHNGDGIRLARQAGAADILHRSTALQQPTVMGAPGGEYGTFGNANALVVGSRSPNCLWVNETGDRICAENSGEENWMALIIPMLSHKQVFSIYDQKAFERNFYGGPSAYDRTASWQYPDDASLKQFNDHFEKNEHKDCVKGADIDELCRKAAAQFPEIDAARLKETIERYNANCRGGKDNDFGKPAQYMQEFATGPFYMIYLPPSVMVTYGALATSRVFEVVDRRREAIPGLYASGNDACELWPNIYTINVQCGTSASHVFSGRQSALAAEKYIGGGKTGKVAESGDTSPSRPAWVWTTPRPLKDGTYRSGAYRGMFGPVTATVTVSGGKIAEIESTHPEETVYVGAYVIADIVKAVKEKQDVGVEVDTVGGATASANAIRFAIKDALDQASRAR
ncbi:MAG: FAD-dependent oxidoreductase [Acidobacteriota bacterium]|nr:FAD-dependent oxidoreductase [Acidobacteriota bacterium]